MRRLRRAAWQKFLTLLSASRVLLRGRARHITSSPSSFLRSAPCVDFVELPGRNYLRCCQPPGFFCLVVLVTSPRLLHLLSSNLRLASTSSKVLLLRVGRARHINPSPVPSPWAAAGFDRCTAPRSTSSNTSCKLTTPPPRRVYHSFTRLLRVRCESGGGILAVAFLATSRHHTGCSKALFALLST